MPETLHIPAVDVRKRVVIFLAFFTSEACREACQAALAPDRLAFELCRLWVEDLYAPGLHAMEGLKGVRDEVAIRHFQEAFSPDEEAALERFHHFLVLRLEMLPAPARRQGRFPQDDRWHNLVRDASYLLETLEADPETVRSGLAWLVDALRRDSASTSNALRCATQQLAQGLPADH